MKNYSIILVGLFMATIGFAYAFSGADPTYSSYYGYVWWQAIIVAYPRLLSGIAIGLGGIAIALTGELYRHRHEA
jgi:ABC-type uncharacterized transport system permease subunit